jgi:hypothetical protein
VIELGVPLLDDNSDAKRFLGAEQGKISFHCHLVLRGVR